MGKVYLICSTYGSGGTGKGIKTMNYHLIFFEISSQTHKQNMLSNLKSDYITKANNLHGLGFL